VSKFRQDSQDENWLIFCVHWGILFVMKSLKQNVEQMIRNLPDDSTVEDIQYHLYVLDKIQKGQEAIRDGKGISHEDAKARLSKWITN
jgi:hypothetical protein